MVSAFAGGIEFLDRIGVYDVVLPFLLVFTLMYAFLEKTKVLGVETYYHNSDKNRKEGWKGSRRNLNSMISFVTAFFVVASSQLVATINQVLGESVLLLLLVFCFILVVGAFHEETKEGFFLDGTWTKIFTVIAFISIALIFLNALGWLEPVGDFIASYNDSDAIASLILVIIIVGFMFWITKGSGGTGSGGKSKSDDKADD